MSDLRLLAYVRHYHFNSIFIKNFITAILLVIVPLTVISLFIYTNNNKVLEYEVKTINMRSLNQAMETINSVIKGSDRIAVDLSANVNAEMFVKFKQYDLVNENSFQNILAMVKSFANSYEPIDSIYIYSEINDFVLSSRYSAAPASFFDISWLEWYESAEVADQAQISARKSGGVYPYLISILRPLYREKKEGAVMVNLNMEKIGKMVYGNDKQSNDNIFIIDRGDRVIFNRDMSLSGKSIREIPLLQGLGTMGADSSMIRRIEGEDYVVSYIQSPYLDLKYVSLVPMNDFKERAGSMRKFLAEAFLTGLLLSVFISFFISLKAYKPLENIISLLERNDGGTTLSHTGMHKEKTSENEIKYIIHNITKSVNTTREQEIELKKRMEMLKKAQVSALLAQINPHFVYNTLETINIKAVWLSGYDNEVSRMVTDLAGLLRLSLESDTSLATVSEEVEHAMLYIRIMERRYEGRFKVEWDIDENILNCKVVKICLQPVMENAIDHGVKLLERQGQITVRGRLEDGKVRIEVHDDGVGMSSETLEKLKLEMNEIYVLKGQHVGLGNVSQRIKILFGDEYGLTVESRENKGTTVCLIYPCL